MSCHLVVPLFIVFLALSGTQANSSTECKKFSRPYDKVEFYEYFSKFVDESRSTKSTTEFCNENEASVPNDIDVIKSLAKNLENILKDVKEEIKEHVGLKKAIDMSRCPVGSGYFQTSFGCFWVSEEEMKHEDAKQHCLSLGMDLASLEHLQSQTELFKLFLELDINMFDIQSVIDLKKDAPGGKWRWTSGAELPGNSPLWGHGEPNNDGREDHWGFFGGGGLSNNENVADRFICSVPQSHKTWNV